MEKLIKLAKEKGFESEAIILKKGSDPSALTTEEHVFYYHLWLCELQKWLRDKYDIHINVNTDLEDGNKEYYVDVFSIDRKNLNVKASEIDYTFEKALEKGIVEALKLIN